MPYWTFVFFYSSHLMTSRKILTASFLIVCVTYGRLVDAYISYCMRYIWTSCWRIHLLLYASHMDVLLTHTSLIVFVTYGRLVDAYISYCMRHIWTSCWRIHFLLYASHMDVLLKMSQTFLRNTFNLKTSVFLDEQVHGYLTLYS